MEISILLLLLLLFHPHQLDTHLFRSEEKRSMVSSIRQQESAAIRTMLSLHQRQPVSEVPYLASQMIRISNTKEWKIVRHPRSSELIIRFRSIPCSTTYNLL
jgi:hypothetical protein